MKKLILCGLLLMFCSFSTVSAATVGNALISRYLDGWPNFNVIDTALQFTDNGIIDSWSIYVESETSAGTSVIFQILRNSSANIYTIIGENEVTVGNTKGIQEFAIADAQKINYQSGDYIGWAFSGTPAFGFTQGDSENSIFHSHDPDTRITGVGQNIDVAEFYSPQRTYSISASTSPVPVPATLILFGMGLLGLTGFSRKKQK